MIVTGLPERTNKAELIKILNEKLETNLTDEDVLYTLKLGQNAGSNSKLVRTKVVFKSKEKKEEVMKRRSKLKNTDLWLADALTSYRMTLAYSARQALKAKKIESTWVYDGKVYMKKIGKERPEIVKTIKDLPK
jgi:hypothetical protein